MQYDPVKKILGNFFNKSPFLRKFFYHLLDLLLLRAWHVHKELRQWQKKNKGPASILDAGSGFGQYTYWLAKKNAHWKILALDVKHEQIEECNQFFAKAGLTNAEFAYGDLTQLNLPPRFHLALTVDVMEHIEEDVLVFQNINRALLPGAMLLISTPSDQGGSDAEHAEDASFIEEHVRNGYNIHEIQQKLVAAGFTKVEAKYSYGWPGKISWRLSMKYPLLLLQLSKIFFIILPVYYIITFPFALLFNYLDVNLSHPTGTGLIVKAYK